MLKEDLLVKIRSSFSQKDFQSTINYCQQFLQQEKRNVQVLNILGQAFFRNKKILPKLINALKIVLIVIQK